MLRNNKQMLRYCNLLFPVEETFHRANDFIGFIHSYKSF